MALRRKEIDYFEHFTISADYAKKAAACLDYFFRNFDYDKFFERMDVMHEIENAADSNKHTMTNELAHEFMTPIEREDIISLAQELDNVVDAIDSVMRRAYMMNVTAIRPEALECCELIIRCCDALDEAVHEFKNFKTSKTLMDKIIVVNDLESQGDKLHAEALHRLFREDCDAKNILVWMTMFEALEDCLDEAEDAADVMESVLMKNT